MPGFVFGKVDAVRSLPEIDSTCPWGPCGALAVEGHEAWRLGNSSSLLFRLQLFSKVFFSSPAVKGLSSGRIPVRVRLNRGSIGHHFSASLTKSRAHVVLEAHTLWTSLVVPNAPIHTRHPIIAP